jgi:amidase
MTDLISLTAREARNALIRKEISPEDLRDAAATRIAKVNPAVNALPTLCLDRPIPTGHLAGLPVAVKDLTDVAGVRTTYGSPIHADHVPESSDILVQRLESNGALVIAKSNTPEWGAGANTFNEVFGKTLNPRDLRLTAGGSSGGSAVAVATGMTWLATGSDLGGSLRIPASFCGVVGLRPSPGRVAHGPTDRPAPAAFDPLWTDGPIARNIGDAALLLDALAGQDDRDPLSFPSTQGEFLAAAEAPHPPRRAAFSADLGIAPVDPEIARIAQTAALRLADLGCDVTDDIPDFSAAHAAFQTLRAANFATAMGETLARHRPLLKPEVVGNIEQGLALTAADIAVAEHQRVDLVRAMAAFFRTHDLLLTPCVPVPPFPVEQRYVTEINGFRLTNYIEWLALTYAITLTGCPALSLPCGFTASGQPVGLQIVGRPRGEAALLSAAAALESHLALPSTPIDLGDAP